MTTTSPWKIEFPALFELTSSLLPTRPAEASPDESEAHDPSPAAFSAVDGGDGGDGAGGGN